MSYFTTKVLQPQKILFRIADRRFARYIILILIAVVTVLYTTLYRYKPDFFSQITALDYRQDSSRFIYKYPNTYRHLKSEYKILLWTRYFGSEDWDLGDISTAFSRCPYSNCALSYDKSELSSSDVLLFHSRDLSGLPKYRTNEQLWVLMTNESPVNDGLHYNKFNGVFNWTGTYHKASEIHTSYGNIHKIFKMDAETDAPVVVDYNKTGVVWIASNCHDYARRQLLIHELKKYIHVDQFGSCGQKKLTSDLFETVLRKYKFYLSFENSVCEDYITEKFFRLLKHGVLPVVFGGGNYKENAPPHSYIDIRDFNNAQEVADYLRYLERNKTAYNEYFEWTKMYRVTMDDMWCTMCQAVNTKEMSHQVYTNLDGWINAGICKQSSTLQKWSSKIDGTAAYYGIV